MNKRDKLNQMSIDFRKKLYEEVDNNIDEALQYDNNMKEILIKALNYYKTGSSRFANKGDHTEQEIDFILKKIT